MKIQEKRIYNIYKGKRYDKACHGKESKVIEYEKNEGYMWMVISEVGRSQYIKLQHMNFILKY